jgi:circadian clock protein KaiB
MKSSERKHDQEKVENAREGCFGLRLYVTGATPNSLRAISNLKLICEAHLAGKYELEIIDIYKQQEKAFEEQIVALPMLVKISPGPKRKLIGDLSDKNKVLEVLGIKS